MQNWELLSASKLNIAIHESKLSAPVCQYNPHRGIVNAAVYNHTNKVIASCGQDSRIELRSANRVEDRKLLDLTFHSISEEPTSINCLQFSNKSKFIAAGAANGLIKVWDMKNHKDVYQKLKGHTSAITSIGWVGGQTAIASSSTGGEIHIHRVSTGKLQTLASRTQDGYNNLKVSEGQGFNRLAASTVSGSLLIWDLNATTKKPFYVHEDPQKVQITCISFSSFKPVLLATASLNSNLSFFDINQKKSIKTISSFEPLTSVCFHHNSHTIAVGGLNGGIWVYDLRKSSENVARYNGHDTSIKTLAFTFPEKEQTRSETRSTASQLQTNDPLKIKDPKQLFSVVGNNKSNPNSQTSIVADKEMQVKNLSGNPSKSKLYREPIKQNSNIAITQGVKVEDREDKNANSRIIRTKRDESSRIHKDETIAPTVQPIDSGNSKYIKNMGAIPSEIQHESSVTNRELKSMEEKLSSQYNELRDEMHDRFDTLHLEFIRQIELGMKTMISKIEEINSENKELKNKVKKLENENESLRKRTY